MNLLDSYPKDRFVRVVSCTLSMLMDRTMCRKVVTESWPLALDTVYRISGIWFDVVHDQHSNSKTKWPNWKWSKSGNWRKSIHRMSCPVHELDGCDVHALDSEVVECRRSTKTTKIRIAIQMFVSHIFDLLLTTPLTMPWVKRFISLKLLHSTMKDKWSGFMIILTNVAILITGV